MKMKEDERKNTCYDLPVVAVCTYYVVGTAYYRKWAFNRNDTYKEIIRSALIRMVSEFLYLE